MLNNRLLFMQILAGLFAGFGTWSPAPAQTALDAPLGVQTDIRPEDVVHWQAMGGETYANGEVRIDLRLTTMQEFTLYQDKLTFSGPIGYEIIKLVPPNTTKLNDPISRTDVDVYTHGEFQIFLRGLEPYVSQDFPLTIKFIACTNRICLFPYTQTLQVPVFAATNNSEQSSDAAAPTITSGNWQSNFAKNLETGQLPLAVALLIVFAAGVLTNLTPCVYPMIPITMRVLARQGHAPMLSAAIYAAGIVITYTSLGLAASMTGTMFGSIMASTTFNVLFAGLMLFLGLGMLGYGNFAALQTLGNRLGAGKPSFKNTLLLGIGAGLVASPCTGPVLAALLAYTAKSGDVRQGSVLLFIYSVGFALPYVFLGGAAAKLTQAKVPPLVQLLVKVLFAAVMVGLALYYLRIPAYRLIKPLAEHYSGIASVSGLLGAACALVILMSPRLQHNKHLLLIPTLLLGLSVFAGWQNLTTASTTGANGATVHWIRSEDEGLALAKASGKPILIDAWAEWCEACKQMDVTTFVDPEVIAELNADWIAIKLDLTETNDENEAVTTRLGIGSLPTLTLVPASGDLTQKRAIIGYVDGGELLQHLQNFRR